MQEIELRFHVPAGQLARLRRLVDPRKNLKPLALAAIYYDGSARELSRAGIGLRLRREGERWVQTVKGPAEDGISRLEHNAELPHGAALVPESARHAGHPLGDSLAALGSFALQPRFRTEISRLRRRQRISKSTEIELAWDEGLLLAGEGEAASRLAVHELELELLDGSVGELLRHAHGLVARLPLSLDLRSKAERGEGLAEGRKQSLPRKSRPLQLRPEMSGAQAWRALLLNCFEQIGANASQIGSGQSGADHVHQLRVGLRRLRSGLRLLGGLWPALEHPELKDFERRAQALGQALGRLREAQLLAQQGGPLQVALAEYLPPGGPSAALDEGGQAEAAACVRAPAVQQWLLECLGWMDWLTRAETGSGPCLREALRSRLRRWQRSLRRDCRRFEKLDGGQRHVLRKRIKRLRYAAEFSAGLFDAERQQAALAPLLLAQELLGELGDAEALPSRLGRDQPADWFALGWSSARRRELLAQCRPLMAALAEGPRLARGKPASRSA